MAKRILVVTQHYWPETFRSTDVCEGLVELGYKVDVLCGLPNYPKGEFFGGYGRGGPYEETHGEVHIYRAYEVPRRGNTSLRIFLNYVSFPFFARLRLSALYKNKYNAVFCYETSPVFMAYPGLAFAKKAGIPCTVYVLDLWPENLYSVLPVKNAFLRAALQKISHWHYKKADRLIAVSPALAAHLISVTGKSAENVVSVPQYCENFYASHARSKAVDAEFKPGCFNILFAGNISPAQSLDTLVLAAALVQKQLSGAVRYTIVGDGMSRAALEAKIKELQLQDIFYFAGPKAAGEIPFYAAAADALFAGLNKSPLLGLTIPAKISSYCAAAKPILACMDGEGARVIKEAGCGYTAAAENVQELAEAICRLYRLSEEERAQMGKAAFRCYETQFKRSDLLLRLANTIDREERP